MKRAPKTFTVQLGDTLPNGWREVKAEKPEEAIEQLLKKAAPTRFHSAWVAVSSYRHANGAPVCVEKYRIRYPDEEAK